MKLRNTILPNFGRSILYCFSARHEAGWGHQRQHTPVDLDFLPGTPRPADRFARASYYINAIATKLDENYAGIMPGHSLGNQSIASVLGVIRDVSVPLRDLSEQGTAGG